MRRSCWRIKGCKLPRTPPALARSASGAGCPSRSNLAIASCSAQSAAAVTAPRYKLLFFALRIANCACAHTSPPSMSSLACSTVTPHVNSPLMIAQSSADGPRSPTMPGCSTRHTWRCQIAAAIARFRKGAMIRSGWNNATASRLTESAMSNSTDTRWPLLRSATNRRCVKLLKAWARNKMRMLMLGTRQQMRGNCSPDSQSTMRRPPKRVRICTKWCGSSATAPMRAARRPSG